MNAPLPRAAIGAIDAAGVEGDGIELRVARPDDLPVVEALVRGLGPASRLQRFFTPRTELPAFLARALREGDGRHHFVVAERYGALLALGQYALLPLRPACDMALLVADAAQGWGLGARLLRRLLDDAAEAGLREMEAEVLPGNIAMLRLAQGFGFDIAEHPDDPRVLRILRAIDAPAPWWRPRGPAGRAAAWPGALV